MRHIFRKTTLAALVSVMGLIGSGTSTAGEDDDHDDDYRRGQGGHHGRRYDVPSYRYYGNGGHDNQPHWHTKNTPYGPQSYYGQGRHDFRPHDHVVTPYEIRSYSYGPYGTTRSYSPPVPYPYPIYRPW